jgi:hypothetical protein
VQSAGRGVCPAIAETVLAAGSGLVRRLQIDLYCILVAGSNALAESFIANLHLEVWRVLAGDPVSADSDE